MTIFLKTASILPDTKTKFLGEIEPFGTRKIVTEKLLDIPDVKIDFLKEIGQGKTTLVWRVEKIELSFKEDAEFGANEVFLINLNKMSITQEFFQFYSNLYSKFKCVLLDQKKFIPITEFKKTVYLP